MAYSAVLGNIELGAFTLGETEVGIPVFEDSLNNWGEAISVTSPLVGGVSQADNLNNWNPVGDAYSSVLGDITLGLFTLAEIGEGESEVSVALGESPSKTVTVADTLSISDAHKLHLGLILDDSNANNWADAAGVDFLIFTQTQTINVGSSLATRPGPGNSAPKDAWKDGVNSTLTPFADIDIAAEDLETFLNSYAQLGIGLIFNDTLTLSDASLVSGTTAPEAFDSMFFNIFDEMSIALGSAKTQSDSINNLSDASSITLFGALENGDTLNLADDISLSVNALPNAGDTLAFNDTVLLVLGTRLSVSDTNENNWADFFTNGPNSTVINITATDTLFMADAANAVLNSSLTSYLRRYLNDVIN